ncbi:PAS domain-containing sensor histidine kinase [Candidatus Nitrospira bockiana]
MHDRPFILYTLASLLIGIFIVDVLTPGVTIWVLYLIPIWLAIYLPRRRFSPVFLIAGIVTALLALGQVYTPAGWTAVVNRLIGIPVLWGTAVLLVRALRSTDALKKSEARFRRTFECNMVPMGVWTRDGRITDANDALLDLVGFSRKDVEADRLRWRDITPGEYRELDDEALHEITARGSCRPYEKEYATKDGRRIPVYIGGATFADRLDSGVFFAIDLSERKQAEGALRTSEQRYRTIVQTANEGIWLVDAEGRTAYVNDRMAVMLGMTAAGMKGRSVFEFVLPDDLPVARQHLSKNIQEGVSEQFDFRFRRSDGGEILVLGCTSPMWNERGDVTGALGMFTDVTDRQRAEDALRASEMRLRYALDAAGMVAWEWQADTDRLVQSTNADRVLGLPAGVTVQTGSQFFALIHPDDRDRVVAQLRTVLAGGGDYQTEFRIAAPDGSIRWVADQGRVAEEPGATGLRMTGVLKDVTERKRAEDEILHLLKQSEQREQALRDKQAQLVQSAKLASLGQLTTGIAHEINNPLNNISLFLGNLLDQFARGPVDPSSACRSIEKALQQVNKAAAIVGHLRTFGRSAPMSRQHFSVHECLLSALGLLSEQFRLRDIELIVDLWPRDPIVFGNRIQLEQVFLNLLTNARDALDGAPRRTLRITSRICSDGVEIAFQDTGIGIPADHLPRIFDPFFTTKAVGRGTGIGLSISHSIIEEHQGLILVESRPHEGATFLIQLPLADPGGRPQEFDTGRRGDAAPPRHNGSLETHGLLR